MFKFNNKWVRLFSFLLGLILIELAENFPTGRAHETLWLICTFFGHLSHFRSGYESEIFFRGACWKTKELHLFGLTVIGSNLKWDNLHSIQKTLLRHKEPLSMPMVVEVLIFFRMSHTSWVSTGDEMSDSCVNS